MEQQEIYEIFYNYISNIIDCSIDELRSDNTIFIKNTKKEHCYVKILSIGDANIVSLSKDIYSIAKEKLMGKNRDELYESTLIFGQTLHYVPDLKQMNMLPYNKDFSFELLVDNEIHKLKGIMGFENSLEFDSDGNTPTCIILYAKKDNEIIALAGASYVNEKIREIGVDVKKSYRGNGLATLLVRNLSVEILRRGKIPFYSASVTNIASQAVAIRSGYMPLWTDSFGVRNIEK